MICEDSEGKQKREAQMSQDGTWSSIVNAPFKLPCWLSWSHLATGTEYWHGLPAFPDVSASTLLLSQPCSGVLSVGGSTNQQGYWIVYFGKFIVDSLLRKMLF